MVILKVLIACEESQRMRCIDAEDMAVYVVYTHDMNKDGDSE